MNSFKSFDFNAGFIFAKVEKKVIEFYTYSSNLTKMEFAVSIPKIQMLPKNTPYSKIPEVIDATCSTVKAQFDDVYGKCFELNYDPENFSSKMGRQYIEVHFTITVKHPNSEGGSTSGTSDTENDK